MKDYGAKGDGTTDDTTSIQNALNAAFGSSASPHGQSTNLNSAVFFPTGTYHVSGNPSLKVTGVKGGLIFGEGMFSTVIQGNTAAAVTFLLNGFGYSCLRDLTITAGTGASVALDYDWDNVAPQGSTCSSFINCVFSGGGTSSIAVRCGHSGYQTDTSTFLNCYFNGANYGLTIQNYNSLGMTVIGGQFLSNNIGIYVPAGGVEVIEGVFFGVNATWDIQITGGSSAYQITACRSESLNFADFQTASITVHVSACSHQCGTIGASGLGTFVQAAATVHIDGCQSSEGEVFMGGGGASLGNVTIRDSVFWRFDGITVFGSGGTDNAATAFINNSFLGTATTGIGVFIGRQRRQRTVIRTFDIEAANISTDLGFLYANYNGPTAQSELQNTLPTFQGQSPTFTVASPTVVGTPSNHCFQGGEPIAFSLVTTGSLPTGISANTVYFVTKDSLTNNFSTQSTCHLSDTQAHALAGTNLVNVSGSGSGAINTWSPRRWVVGDKVLNTAVTATTSPGWVCTTAGWAPAVNAGETQAVFTAMPVL